MGLPLVRKTVNNVTCEGIEALAPGPWMSSLHSQLGCALFRDGVNMRSLSPLT
jgi:hypothetical protein